MKRTSFAILIGLFCLFPALFSQVRSEFLLEKNWKFTREDSPEFINPTFNDSKWQSVTVPHDWAIYGPFSSQNDKQEVAIAQDGQTEAMEHAGRTGGLPFVGVGWYRTEFEVPQFTDGKRATILFDGAMSHAKVYVNGQEVGYWPYGYNSFYFDITKQLMPGKKNTLAVRLENLPESSRWYKPYPDDFIFTFRILFQSDAGLLCPRKIGARHRSILRSEEPVAVPRISKCHEDVQWNKNHADHRRDTIYRCQV